MKISKKSFVRAAARAYEKTAGTMPTAEINSLIKNLRTEAAECLNPWSKGWIEDRVSDYELKTVTFRGVRYTLRDISGVIYDAKNLRLTIYTGNDVHSLSDVSRRELDGFCDAIGPEKESGKNS